MLALLATLAALLAVRDAPSVVTQTASGSAPGAARRDARASVARDEGAETELERVNRLARELAALGFEIDVAELKVEMRVRDDCRADIDVQQDLLFAPQHYEAASTLLASLGLGGRLTGAELRAVTVATLLDSLQAYYQSDRRALVLVAGASGAAHVEATDRAWLHELVHAWQDRELSFAELYAVEPRTTEGSRLLLTLLEGHAEAVALGALLARRGLGLGDFDPDDGAEQLGQLVTGMATTLPYRHGLQFFLAAHGVGGSEAVLDALRARPASTEQILHPSKLGTDAPTVVREPPALPAAAWPGATRLHSDTLGELTILALLLEAGLGAQRSTLAATGWDGDRLVVWRGLRPPDASSQADLPAEAEEALVQALTWRSVWDREVDAVQFAGALVELFGGTVQRRGRVVDAVWAEDERVARALAAALTATSQVDGPTKSDEASTADVEGAWLARQSRSEAEHWVLPDHGLRVPIPSGWALREVRGVPALKRVAPLAAGLAPADAGFDDNISVTSTPQSQELTTAALRERSEQGLAEVEFLSLDSSSVVDLGGRDAVLLRYHGRPPGARSELAFASLTFLRAGRLVTVTGTARLDRWSRVGPTLEDALRGVQVAQE